MYQKNKIGLKRVGEYGLTDIKDVLKKLRGDVFFF